MPIHRRLRQGELRPEDAARLERAFQFTLRALHLIDRDDPVCDIIAHKVVEIDRAGTHDPNDIARIAAKHFGIAK